MGPIDRKTPAAHPATVPRAGANSAPAMMLETARALEIGMALATAKGPDIAAVLTETAWWAKMMEAIEWKA